MEGKLYMASVFTYLFKSVILWSSINYFMILTFNFSMEFHGLLKANWRLQEWTGHGGILSSNTWTHWKIRKTRHNNISGKQRTVFNSSLLVHKTRPENNVGGVIKNCTEFFNRKRHSEKLTGILLSENLSPHFDYTHLIILVGFPWKRHSPYFWS